MVRELPSWPELVRHGGILMEARREASGQARGAPLRRAVHARRVPDPRPRASAGPAFKEDAAGARRLLHLAGQTA